MSKAERIAIWVIISFLIIVNLIGGVMIVGELQAINAVLAGRDTGGSSSDTEPTPWWGGGNGPTPPPTIVGTIDQPRVGIAGVEVISETIAMTVAVRSSSGSGGLLAEAPVLVDQHGHSYYPIPDSLEGASYDFLKLITTGQAETRLAFAGQPAEGDRLTLIFNPGQQPGDTTAPRVEVSVPVITRPATPTPEPTPEGGR